MFKGSRVRHIEGLSTLQVRRARSEGVRLCSIRLQRDRRPMSQIQYLVDFLSPNVSAASEGAARSQVPPPHPSPPAMLRYYSTARIFYENNLPHICRSWPLPNLLCRHFVLFPFSLDACVQKDRTRLVAVWSKPRPLSPKTTEKENKTKPPQKMLHIQTRKSSQQVGYYSPDRPFG